MKNTKQGSALLIVLGFLSFMVVSAVAFSIYMRSERLPSSAMRRTVTTRHLVKAALARAIGDIDDALRAEPFPGCMGDKGPTIQNAQSGKWNKYGNARRASWVGRVFMPLAWMDRDGDEAVVENRHDGQIDSTSDNGDLYSIPSIRLDRDSVSTMTLEGLGYVPPPLVNEARLLGRRSWSSAWRYFDYDAGRYAYTALNVSDYFDINRLNANTNRNSGGAGRISLAYLFADTNGKVNQSQVREFDNFVSSTRGGEAGQYPFVSMLDYSLALQNTLSGNLANPFFDRLTGGGNQSAFYGKVFPISTDRASSLLSLMTDTVYLKNARPVFLTDSWFGATNTTYRTDVCDLSYPQWQPFWKYEDGYDPLSLCFPPKTPFLKELLINDSFSLPAVFALYDYLDEDSQPSSLVMPCLERAPMICGFRLVPYGGVQLSLTCKQTILQPAAQGQPSPGTKEEYFMKFNIPKTDVHVSLVYPFKRDRPGESTSYKVQAFARVFFAPAGAPARTGGFGTIDWTTRAAQTSLAQLDANPTANQQPNPTGVTPPNSTILLISEKKSITVPSSIATEEDANCGNGFYVSLPAYDSQTDKPGDGWKILETETLTGQSPQIPSTFSGSEFAFLDAGYAQIAQLPNNTPLVPQISLVLRVEGDDGTVDLVPANFADDALIDKSIDPSYATRWNSAVTLRTSYLPNNVPLFKFATTFSGGKTFALDPTALQALVAGASGTPVPIPTEPWPTDAYVCCDPRYNWAPEDWVKRTDNGDLYQIWLDRAHELLGADSAHDVDIFMEVSNAGYLQSAYEFMFLPRVCDWSENHSACGVWGLLNGSGRYPDGNPKGDVKDLANYGLMWRSFLPKTLGGEDVFEKLGTNERGVQNNATGFRINPYTDNAMIFRAAIENTPLGWWAASTNDTTSSRGSAFKNNDLKKGLEYTFGPNSDFDKDKWAQEKVIAVSEALRTALAGAPSANSGLPAAADAWKTAFDAIWANSFDADDENKLFGIDMGSATLLHGVDRKFLYGFWRDCFACSQQLFLIFVRAESTALGGSGEGRTPGQLGGRAVALVWRDPKEPPSSWEPNDDKLELPYAMAEGEQTKEKTRTPHKTRILFYHQFD